jgi:hypothetical protein
MARRKLSRKRRVWAAIMSIRSLLDTVLLLLILGLLLDRQGWRSSLFEVGGDITGFAPRCKLWCNTVHRVVFADMTRSCATDQDVRPRPRVCPRQRVRFFYRRGTSEMVEHSSKHVYP